ncbi:MAG: TetR/AcrR family transcriptional regulator [Methylococcaceae bacterium]|jgi:AcrR family transcriptional regulator
MCSETVISKGITAKQLQIVRAAYDLFKENGFYATGVDLIMRRAQVSKRTMYSYFVTKNQLILAVLGHYRNNCQDEINQILQRPELSSQDKILAVFENAEKWFVDTKFHGCLAVNAMAEFAGKDEAIEQACHQFKVWELDVLRSLCTELGVQNSAKLAYKLLILLEGMGAIAQFVKQPCLIDIKQLVLQVMDSHTMEQN